MELCLPAAIWETMPLSWHKPVEHDMHKNITWKIEDDFFGHKWCLGNIEHD